MEFPQGESTSTLRAELEDEAREYGARHMHRKLAAIDPESADLIHPNNVRRTIRALEMAEGGVSYAEQAAGFAERTPHYEAAYIGLDMDRQTLYTRIEARVDEMLDNGLLDEVRRLLDMGYRDALTAGQAIGYKEFVPVIEKSADVATATAEVKHSSRRYAKRQLTWFRGDPRVQWIDVTESSPEDTFDRARSLIES
jgi:tRNA dimethylallyltransferase